MVKIICKYLLTLFIRCGTIGLRSKQTGGLHMKTLYFEGAGCVPRGEVENCRIRTAFTNDEGKGIYLEMVGVETSKNSPKSLQQHKFVGFVDSCHYLTEEGENDENNNRIARRNEVTFEYTKENILAYVNSLGCTFDQVVILPDLAGYRVFPDGGGHNYGDQFQYDEGLTSKREEVYSHYFNLEQSEGKKHPNFSLWADDAGKLHLLRHFNGYNKHWEIIITEDGFTPEETVLGQCGC